MFSFLTKNHKKISYVFLIFTLFLFFIIYSVTLSNGYLVSQVYELIKGADDVGELYAMVVPFNCHLAFGLLSIFGIIGLLIAVNKNKIKPRCLLAGVLILFAMQGLSYTIIGFDATRVGQDLVPGTVPAIGSFGLILLLVSITAIVFNFLGDKFKLVRLILSLVSPLLLFIIIAMDYSLTVSQQVMSVIPAAHLNTIDTMLLFFTLTSPIYFLSYLDDYSNEEMFKINFKLAIVRKEKAVEEPKVEEPAIEKEEELGEHEGFKDEPTEDAGAEEE